MVVCHNNGMKIDNHVENLRYGTPAENESDKAAHGTKLIGERHHAAKLTDQNVIDIRSRYVPFSRKSGAKALAAEFGVSQHQVHMIVTGKHWTHLLPKQNEE